MGVISQRLCPTLYEVAPCCVFVLLVARTVTSGWGAPFRLEKASCPILPFFASCEYPTGHLSHSDLLSPQARNTGIQ